MIAQRLQFLQQVFWHLIHARGHLHHLPNRDTADDVANDCFVAIKDQERQAGHRVTRSVAQDVNANVLVLLRNAYKGCPFCFEVRSERFEGLVQSGAIGFVRLDYDEADQFHVFDEVRQFRAEACHRTVRVAAQCGSSVLQQEAGKIDADLRPNGFQIEHLVTRQVGGVAFQTVLAPTEERARNGERES